MGVRLVTEILDRYHGPDHRKLWLIAWAENANDGTRAGWPTRQLLSHRTGRSPSRTSHIADELVAEGVLKRDGGGNRSGPARFILLPLGTPEKGAPSAHSFRDRKGAFSPHPEETGKGAPSAHPKVKVKGARSPIKGARSISLPAETGSLPLSTTPLIKNSPTESSSSPAKPQRDDVERICAHLADRITGNGSKPPAVTQRWRTEARLLLDKDGRTEQQVHTAIDWCQDDAFWKSNIMSMPKLREQYDRLRLQAIEQRHGRAGPVTRADKQQEQRARQLARAQRRERDEANGSSPAGGVHPGLLPAADHR